MDARLPTARRDNLPHPMVNPMARKSTGKTQRMSVVDSRTESADRVVNHLRPVGSAKGQTVEIHAADWITDDQHIPEQHSQVDVTVTITPVTE